MKTESTDMPYRRQSLKTNPIFSTVKNN